MDLNYDGKRDEVYNIGSNDLELLKNEEQNAELFDRVDKLMKGNGAFSVIITKINDNISVLDSSFITIEECQENMVGFNTNCSTRYHIVTILVAIYFSSAF